MLKGVFQNSSPILKIVFSALTVIIVFFVFLFIGLLVAIPVFGLNLDNYSSFTNLSDPVNIDFLKYLQVIQSTGLFILPSIIIAFFLGKSILSYLKLDIKPLFSILALALICLVFAMPIIGLFGELNSSMKLPEFFSGIEQWMKNMEESTAGLMESFLKTDNLSALLLNIFMVGIIAGVGEELMFRGVIQKIFTDWTRNIHAGVIIAAILFSAMHLQFYGFLPRLLLGLFLGYLFVWSGSLWIPILVHIIYNSFAVVLYYLFESGHIATDPDSLQTGSNSIYTIILSFALTGAMIYLIKRKSVLTKFKY